jgi:hypothetical protein
LTSGFETVLSENGLTCRAGQPLQKLPSRSLVRCAGYNAAFLQDPGVPVLRNELCGFTAQQRSRRDDSIRIAGVKELKGLADVFSVDNLRLNFPP